MRTSIHGRSAPPRHNNGIRGITLIELLVAMAIVGAIFALAASGLRSALDTELKNSARHLSSLIRYLRIKAVTEHKYIQLVCDLENDKYWVEETTDPMVISVAAETPPPISEGSDEEPAVPPENETLQKAEGMLVKEEPLGSGVFFKDLNVSYLREKQEEGKLSLYFFPDGYATPALINLRNEEDDAHYSLEVFPFSGKVRVEGTYRELETK